MSAISKPYVAKQAAMQINAGCSAGFIEVCFMHPLDVVRTRLQLQIKKPLAGGNTGRPLNLQSQPIFTAFVVNPFEVVKISLHSDTAKATTSPSTMIVAREIIKRGGIGLNGLNKGLTSTIGRNGTWNLIYFGFYHSVKDSIPQCQNPTADFFRKTGIGFASGTIASIANIPFDVAKSRIQVIITNAITANTKILSLSLLATEKNSIKEIKSEIVISVAASQWEY